MTLLFIFIVFIVSLLAFICIRKYFVNQNSLTGLRYLKGELGEGAVKEFLDLLDHNEYKVINNALFCLKDDVTIQVDHIVVSRTGIYVIETKNYGGVVMQDFNDKWKQTWFKKDFYFYSPVKQNESHIKSLMYVLFTKNRDLFKSLIVFPNNTVLSVQQNTPAIQLSNLCSNIENNTRHIMTYEQVNKIYKTLCARNIYSAENMKKHRERVARLYH